MYKVVKNVISNKGYDLKDILTKIDTMWLKGSLTDAQRDELIALARDNANVQDSISIIAKLEELDKRVLVLENKIASMEQTETEDETTETTTPAYVAGKWYYTGDEVTFEGNTYTCIAPDGVVCTWSPSEYPAYWQIKE